MNRHCEERSDAAIQKTLRTGLLHLRFAMTIMFLLLGLAGIARAETREGPTGCTWNATVKKTTKSSITVHIDEQYGSCVDEPCPADADGEIFTLPSKKHKAGEVVKVWVDLDKKGNEHATLDIPKCWTQTVKSKTPAPDTDDNDTSSFATPHDSMDVPPVSDAPKPDPVTSDDLAPIGKPQ